VPDLATALAEQPKAAWLHNALGLALARAAQTRGPLTAENSCTDFQPCSYSLQLEAAVDAAVFALHNGWSPWMRNTPDRFFFVGATAGRAASWDSDKRCAGRMHHELCQMPLPHSRYAVDVRWSPGRGMARPPGAGGDPSGC